MVFSVMLQICFCHEVTLKPDLYISNIFNFRPEFLNYIFKILERRPTRVKKHNNATTSFGLYLSIYHDYSTATALVSTLYNIFSSIDSGKAFLAMCLDLSAMHSKLPKARVVLYVPQTSHKFSVLLCQLHSLPVELRIIFKLEIGLLEQHNLQHTCDPRSPSYAFNHY